MVTIGSLAVDGAPHYDADARGVMPLFSQLGVKLRERLCGREALVGADYPDLIAVMEFPSEAAIKSFLASDAYRALIPNREKAFREPRTFICETL